MASLVVVVAILEVDLVVLLGPLPQAVGRGEDEHRIVGFSPPNPKEVTKLAPAALKPPSDTIF